MDESTGAKPVKVLTSSQLLRLQVAINAAIPAADLNTTVRGAVRSGLDLLDQYRMLAARVRDLEERLRIMSAQELDAVSRPAAYAPAARAWGSAYIHDLRACGSVGWFQSPPTDGGCESCESGSLNPADWQPLYVATTAPAEPTDAEVEAAAFALNDGSIDPDDPHALARAALSAAAAVRAGQAVTA